MNWISLLIPLIVLVVWILSNLARQEEPPRRGGNRVRRPIPGPKPQAQQQPRRSADEVDRFLASLRQKRQEEQESEKQSAQPPPVPERRSKPAPPPTPTRSSKPRPQPSTAEKVIPILTPTPMPSRDTDVVREASRTVVDLPEPVGLPDLPKLGSLPLRKIRIRGRSQASEKLLKMLRDPESLQTAFLMREVFAPPLASRPSALPRRRD